MATRWTTITFEQDLADPTIYVVDVTEPHKEVESGDVMYWHVRDAPEDADVAVKNFKYWGGPVEMTYNNGVVKTKKAKHKDPKPSGKLTLDTTGVDLGTYKYEVWVDGVMVLDPDLEIKRPI